MKNRTCTGFAIAAALCLGTATVAGAQVVRPGTGAFPGGSIYPPPSGSLGNGYNGNAFGNNGIMPNSANGFGMQSGAVIPNSATGFNPFGMQNGSSMAGSFFNSMNPFGAFYAGGNNYNYYGGYGFGDPSFAVTPYGIMPMGYGYNGYQGSGSPSPSDWEILRSAYAQGYQDAANQAAAAEENNTANNQNGMTATPRNAVARVPHGSDGVRMWRSAGRVALRWQGDPRLANSVTFSVADRSGRALRSTTVDTLPAEVHFTPPANAAFYQVVVHYVDGATNTIMGKLPQ